jgi:SAM-dependent methyltransferase
MADDDRSAPHRLNLGAAKTYIPGFVNIDIHESAEVSLDLGVERLPFADDSVSTVVSHHTLEHVPDYLFALGEIHRVLEHDGELLLSLPYATLTENHMVNPYHLHNFTERSFDFFDPMVLKGSAAEDGEIMFRTACVRYTYMGYFAFAPKWLRVWARKHLLNVVRQFDIALVAIKDPSRPVDTGSERARRLEARIVELKRKRTPYPRDGQRPAETDGGAADVGPARRGAGSRLRRVRGRLQGALRRRTQIRHD